MKKETDEEPGDEELDGRRNTAAPVPAAETVAREELASAWPWETQDVLEVWRRCCQRAGYRRIERSTHRGEQQDRGDTRTDLEAPVGDVAVWHPITEKVEEQSERQRAKP